ncbi:zinc ABC transporter solute-binding protein [Halobaculum sp. WSA2]|uniref:Zinc ABC transporter solute-binding protein n=1 Tax=Halobaculum saliterrae TaxID=2073113 RepID=A0A6B0T5Y3_9EURY|nr:metal ABC transporter substrate-binding protein [Halobaculum saliterrae]MXR41899.1 zinc ABC transporter solute-binding protein [Halobaculum saliterrae]
MEHTRRTVLGSVGAVGVGALAGCLGSRADASGSSGGDAASGDAAAQATFFVFGDLARAVAGDATSTDLLVPVGQHGHGWEPGPRVRESIRAADLLVHGMDGFQPWVDDVLTDLDADGEAVAAVDVSAEVDLLAPGEEGDHDHDHDHGSGDDHHGEHETETGDHHEENETHTDDRDHGTGADPHFWMDPLRVRTAVGTVREALSSVDPDGADAHEANAATFREELDALHERLDSTIAEADRDVLLVAGHNSVRYLGERYGLHVETLTGLAPDDRPTTRDIERAQEVIAEHDLRHVCADPIESQRAADQLVEETDAEAVLPLTAMPGLTDEWAENDWGYLDVMREVNVPTLERALTR